MQCLILLLFFIHLCMYLTLYDDNIIIIVLTQNPTNRTIKEK